MRILLVKHFEQLCAQWCHHNAQPPYFYGTLGSASLSCTSLRGIGKLDYVAASPQVIIHGPKLRII